MASGLETMLWTEVLLCSIHACRQSVEESLQGLGGVGISGRRSLVAASERPVAI